MDNDQLYTGIQASTLYSEPSDNLENLNKYVLKELIESQAPLKSCIVAEIPLVPWITQDIIDDKKQEG